MHFTHKKKIYHHLHLPLCILQMHYSFMQIIILIFYLLETRHGSRVKPRLVSMIKSRHGNKKSHKWSVEYRKWNSTLPFSTHSVWGWSIVITSKNKMSLKCFFMCFWAQINENESFLNHFLAHESTWHVYTNTYAWYQSFLTHFGPNT